MSNHDEPNAQAFHSSRYESLVALLRDRDSGQITDEAFLEMVMDRIAQAEARGAVEALRAEAKTLRTDATIYQGFKGDKVRRAMTADLARRLSSKALTIARAKPTRCAEVVEGLRCVFDDGHGCDHGFDQSMPNAEWETVAHD